MIASSASAIAASDRQNGDDRTDEQTRAAPPRPPPGRRAERDSRTREAGRTRDRRGGSSRVASSRPEPQRHGRDADSARRQQVDQRPPATAAPSAIGRDRQPPPERRAQEHRGQPARPQDQPAEKQVAPRRDSTGRSITTSDPAAAGRGDQPAQPARRSVRLLVADRSLGYRQSVCRDRRVPGETFARHRRHCRSRGRAEQVPEPQGQRRPAGRARPRARRRPDLEEQVVRVEDLLARLRQLVPEVGRAEVARPDAPTRTSATSGARQARPSPAGDHAPGRLASIPSDSGATSSTGSGPRDRAGRSPGRPRPAPRRRTSPATPARQQADASRPAAATARPRRPAPTSSPSQALRLLVRIRQTSRTRITGAAMASAAHRDPVASRSHQVLKPDGQRQHERPDEEAGQRVGQREGRQQLVRTAAAGSLN